MKTISVAAPYDRQIIDKIACDDEASIEDKLARAHAVFLDRDHWLKPYERIAILEKLSAIIASRQQALAKTAAHEGGKPLQDSLVEVERGLLGVKTAIQTLMQMGGKEIPMQITPSSDNRMAYTYREPVGVVLAISAFNHPFNLIIHQVVAAIAAGCPVLVKPSSDTPLSCFKVIGMLQEAGLPAEWAQVAVCNNRLAERMVSDARIKFLSFIGSSKVGWYLRTKIAAGTHCVLEHGGAAPVIIEPDADIDDALPLLAKGGFYHAGQVCVSVQRVFAHARIVKQVSRGLADIAKNLRVGDPLLEKTEVGPLIDPKEVERVDNWVQQAVANGAKLLCGGKPVSETCYQPTVLLDPPEDVNVSRQEIFGPVVCVYSYRHRLRAVQQANRLPFSFQGAVFTKNIDVALDTVQRLNATAVMINDHTAFRVDWMPFGGQNHSGLGVGGIPYTMRDMTYEKMWVLRAPARST